MIFQLKAPSFWYPKDDAGSVSFLQKCLKPVSSLYGSIAVSKINKKSQYTSKLPVICLGNVVAGGTGKTPCAIYIFKRAKELGLAQNPCFLTRGYGGKYKHAVLVDPKKHSNEMVGDEALMLAEIGPIITSPDRVNGAKLAEELGYDMIIMDDGFQNPSLHKDINILVVDGRGFGNGHLLPAGPLREPVQNGLNRSDCVLFTDSPNVEALDTIHKAQKPSYSVTHLPASLDDYDLNRSYVAFAGIGNPEKFKTTLKMNGFNITEFIDFGDHYQYSDLAAKKLIQKAIQNKAKLITTLKDYVRFPHQYRKHLNVLNIQLEVVEKNDFDAFLSSKINAKKS